MSDHRPSPARRPSSAASKVLAVAWREFKYTALTKAFIFGAVIVPLLIWAIFGLTPFLMRHKPPPIEGTFAIVDPSGRVSAEAGKRFEEMAKAEPSVAATVSKVQAAAKSGDANQLIAAAAEQAGPVRIKVQAETDPGRATALREEVRAGKLLGVAIVDPKLLAADAEGAKLSILVPTGSSPRHTSIYEDVLSKSTVRARVEATGGNYDQLSTMMRRPDLDTERLTPEGGSAKEKAEIRMIIPIGFMMLLWISTFTSGNYLLTTTIEEKSNKVMEVLLSAVSPMQLLTGKILGQALVSAVMLVIYGSLGAAALIAFAFADLVSPTLIVYLVLYYLMAYFMVASIMAAVGSAVSELREAQALITPAMLVLMVPLMLWLPISDNPNGVLATVTSFIPPLIPFVMILRVSGTTEPIAFWQILATLVLGYGAVFGMIWLAARIFRVGVLMQGKPPSPLELLKWATYR